MIWINLYIRIYNIWMICVFEGLILLDPPKQFLNTVPMWADVSVQSVWPLWYLFLGPRCVRVSLRVVQPLAAVDLKVGHFLTFNLPFQAQDFWIPRSRARTSWPGRILMESWEMFKVGDPWSCQCFGVLFSPRNAAKRGPEAPGPRVSCRFESS